LSYSRRDDRVALVDSMMRMRGWIVCLVLAVSGCGGDGDEKPAAESPATQRTTRPRPTSTIEFVADRKIPLRWTRKTYRAKAGQLELRVVNPSEAPHSIAVEQSRQCCKQPGSSQFGISKTVSTGETTQTVVTLTPGRYWAYCGVDGHWQGGMVSQLIVR
jgi:hypothetical protein